MELSASTIKRLGEVFASDRPEDQEEAHVQLEALLDQDQAAVMRLLTEQLEADPDARRRLGYVRALRETASPAAVRSLLRALNREFDTKVWQAIYDALEQMSDLPALRLLKIADRISDPALQVRPGLLNQPTRTLLENLVVSGPSHRTRFEAAQTLLNFSRGAPRSIPRTTAQRLVGFLGASEEFSYPAADVLASVGDQFQDVLMTSIVNPHSEDYVQRVLEEADPQGRWTRTLFPRIELSRWCTLGVTASMNVQLVMPERATHQTPINVEFREGEVQAEVQVSVTSPDFDVARDWETIFVEQVGDSTAATFLVTPHRTGRARLSVEFFRAGQRIGLVVVRTFVSGPDGPWEYEEETERWLNQQVVSLENPAFHLNDQPYGRTFVARARSFENPGERVAWYDPVEIDPPEELSNAVKWQEAEAYFERFRSQLAEMLEQMHRVTPRIDLEALAELDQTTRQGKEYKKYLEFLEFMAFDLQSIGGWLYQNIVAPDIRKNIGQLKPGTPLHFITDPELAWVPWELVYDANSKAFWGELYPIGRLATPLSDPQSHRIEGAANGHPQRRIVNVAGDGLVRHEKYLPELVKLLQEPFAGLPDVGGNVKLPFEELLSVPRFAQAVTERDVVHLTCLSERDQSEGFYLRLGPEVLHRLRIRHFMNTPLEPQSLVFANACSTTSATLLFNEYSSIAWAVYQKNAGAFIGTVAPVPSGEAYRFAKVLYTQLREEQQPVGVALYETKRIFKEKTPCHPFYLLYCLYGDTQWRW
jgi:CHAT domain-containing protein